MKLRIGDVVEVSEGYGTIQQIIGKNLRVTVSGHADNYGVWYTVDQIISHATRYPKR